MNRIGRNKNTRTATNWLLSALSLVMIATSPAQAGKGGGAPAPGSLDPTFDGDGKAVTDLSGNSDHGTSVLVQADGKILVGGGAGGGGATDFGLVRYNPGGGLDSGFGAGGKAATDFGASVDNLMAIQLQSDGKILAGGEAGNDFGLARYNADGTLDPGFGLGGRVITVLGANKGVIYDLAVQSDGRIVAAGTRLNGIHGCGRCGGFFFDYSIVLARYNVDGSLDASFGSNGIAAMPDLDPATLSEEARSLEIQPDGKILVAGIVSDNAANTSGILAARYNSDGSPDTAFGVGGRVRTDIGLWVEGYALALQSDGRFVVAGSSAYNFALARYNPDGSLDASFGTNGTVVTDMGGGDYAQGLAVQLDGKIVAAGRTDISVCNRKGVCTGKDFALARYNPNGTLDSGFGAGGQVTLGLATLNQPLTGAYGVALQADGRIVAAGTVYTLSQGAGNYTDYYDFGVARFIP